MSCETCSAGGDARLAGRHDFVGREGNSPACQVPAPPAVARSPRGRRVDPADLRRPIYPVGPQFPIGSEPRARELGGVAGVMGPPLVPRRNSGIKSRCRAPTRNAQGSGPRPGAGNSIASRGRCDAVSRLESKADIRAGNAGTTCSKGGEACRRISWRKSSRRVDRSLQREGRGARRRGPERPARRPRWPRSTCGDVEVISPPTSTERLRLKVQWLRSQNSPRAVSSVGDPLADRARCGCRMLGQPFGHESWPMSHPLSVEDWPWLEDSAERGGAGIGSDPAARSSISRAIEPLREAQSRWRGWMICPCVLANRPSPFWKSARQVVPIARPRATVAPCEERRHGDQVGMGRYPRKESPCDAENCRGPLLADLAGSRGLGRGRDGPAPGKLPSECPATAAGIPNSSQK